MLTDVDAAGQPAGDAEPEGTAGGDAALADADADDVVVGVGGNVVGGTDGVVTVGVGLEVGDSDVGAGDGDVEVGEGLGFGRASCSSTSAASWIAVARLALTCPLFCSCTTSAFSSATAARSWR
jgi:hypothetical protein